MYKRGGSDDRKGILDAGKQYGASAVLFGRKSAGTVLGAVC